MVITLGPSFDKGPESHHFYFSSGARLSSASHWNRKAQEADSFRTALTIAETIRPNCRSSDSNYGNRPIMRLYESRSLTSIPESRISDYPSNW
jgi:hypothetical protein